MEILQQSDLHFDKLLERYLVGIDVFQVTLYL